MEVARLKERERKTERKGGEALCSFETFFLSPLLRIAEGGGGGGCSFEIFFSSPLLRIAEGGESKEGGAVILKFFFFVQSCDLNRAEQEKFDIHFC